MTINKNSGSTRSQQSFFFNMVYQRFQQLYKSEEGATMVYVAITMVMLLGMAAIALDGSNLYLQRRKLQTSADAAALAGVHAMANGLSEAEVMGNINAYAASNNSTAENIVLEDNSVALNAMRPVETYFARILSVDSVDVDAYSKVRYDPIYAIEPPPLCFDASCVQENQEVVIIGDEAQTYCADSLEHWSGGPRSALYIHNPEPENTVDSGYDESWMEFDRHGPVGVYQEYLDGTARLTMDVMNGHGRGFEMEVRLLNRTSNPPNPNSPYVTDGTAYSPVEQWHYYSDWEITLRGLAGTPYEGAVIEGYGYSNGSNEGAAFQVGQGATYYREDKFGASGWAWLNIVQQPASGITLLGPTGWSASDVFLELELCNHLAEEVETETTNNSCTFTFLDWNGDVDSPQDIADQISDTAESGVHTVGEVVDGADWYNNRAPIENALSDWFDQPVAVPVCGNQQDGGTYEILGFTGFQLEEMDFSQFPSGLSGTFVPIVVDSSPIPDGMTLPDFLARTITLVE